MHLNALAFFKHATVEANARFTYATFAICSEDVVKVDKRKKIRMPDLRRVKGTALVTETNANFAGNAPVAEDVGLGLASPDVGVRAIGQTTHE